MVKKTEIKSKLTRLQEILNSNNTYSLPLLIRFKTQLKSSILSVNKVEFDEVGIKIFNGNSGVLAVRLALEQITGIDALCDSKRKPVFLNSLNDMGEVDLNKMPGYYLD